MKIIHYFNLCNVALNNVKAINSINDPIIEGRLLVNGNEYESLNIGRSEMIPYNYHFGFSKDVYNNKFSMLRKADLIHCYAGSPLWIQFLGRPYIAHSTGSDLREIASSTSLQGHLLRWAYKKAKAFLYHQPDQLDYLKYVNNKNIFYIPLAIRTSDYPKVRPQPKEKFRFLHIARQEWKTKGNDRVFKAFNRLKETHKNVYLDWINTGIDKEKSYSLWKEQGWEYPFLNQQALTQKILTSDCVIDQFVLGSLGVSAMQTLATDQTLITYISEEYYKKFYPELPPVYNARTEDEIFNAMKKVVEGDTRKGGRDWVEKYHSYPIVGDTLKEIYSKVMGGLA